MTTFLLDYWPELGAYRFLQTAFIAGLLASISCGIVGSFVVVKRLTFLAGGISHSVLAGMGAALYFGFSPVGGALCAAIIAAFIIGILYLHSQTQEDTLIGAIWAIGMAIGILFIAKTPGYTTDLMSYLVGNILLVTPQDLNWMLMLDGVLLLLMALFYPHWLAIAFDEEFAYLRAIAVPVFYLSLLCLVAVTVVLLIQVVGLILVMALLTLPAATASHYGNTLGTIMGLATVFSSLFTSLGLILAYQLDLPAGPTIILVAGLAFILSAIIQKLRA